MLSSNRVLKLFRLIHYSWGRHAIWCLLLFAAELPKAAWGISVPFNLELRNLQTSPEDDSDSMDLLASVLQTTSISPTSSPVSSYTLEDSETSQSIHSELTHGEISSDVLYLAAPENLNPGLYIPTPVEPSSKPITPEPIAPDFEEPESIENTSVPIWEIDDLTVNLSDDFSNFGQGNRIIEPTMTGSLPNGDQLAIMMGFNRYAQSDVDTVFNVPLKASWTREMGDFTTTAGGGVDLFNQLPVALNLIASTSVPVGKKAVLSFFVDHGPYKFNTTTLNNQITAWRYGPNLYWQITPDMYLFSLARWGRYNDGNREQQSFSRLEKKLGDFYVAGNLFTWRYREDAESTSGYFSPPDFLVANAEIGWQGEVLEWLDCGAVASWGRQRLNGSWSSAYSYNAKCTFEIAESLEMDLGYAFSNVIGQTGGSAFNNRTITGQVRAKF
ncbi:hypothetical protein N836_29755 [Leptolyngbya sp. Heron Island J]|uniref:hypothetical protein n=1 Tax=Leptolyngbya sp. Heron Island J TaxID=1385935 RepID=UPI0003B99146|nr:hypothetical protein [Leptolyngbya sp. Heron Island J]ESA38983.1 hypothetical protein N836_29755 [Leptolyngbya sp. Heron Island J]